MKTRTNLVLRLFNCPVWCWAGGGGSSGALGVLTFKTIIIEKEKKKKVELAGSVQSLKCQNKLV